jgi:cell division protein FtsQ
MTTTHTPLPPADRSLSTRPPRRQWPYVLALFLVLALAGGGAYVVYRTPVFGVTQLEVAVDTGDLPGEVSDAVKTAADVPQGTPLMTVDLAALRRRVLGVPQIATAAVSRHWPNSVIITVGLRTPVAATMANGSLYLLDESGYPYLKVAQSQVPSGLFTIALATPGRSDPSTLAALAVIGSIKPPIRAAVSSVSARSAYDVELQLRDGRSVIWGSPDDGAKKMQILPAVLTRPGKVFDVSDPDIVTVSP